MAVTDREIEKDVASIDRFVEAICAASVIPATERGKTIANLLNAKANLVAILDARANY